MDSFVILLDKILITFVLVFGISRMKDEDLGHLLFCLLLFSLMLVLGIICFISTLYALGSLVSSTIPFYQTPIATLIAVLTYYTDKYIYDNLHTFINR